MIPAAAPTILEPALSAPAATPAVAPGTPAFDAILMMQNVAATPECLGPDIPEADTDELFGAAEDEDGDELETSLEFLTDLMAVAMPSDQARQFQGDGASPEDPGEEQPPTTFSTKSGAGSFLEAAKSVLTQTETQLPLEAVPPETTEPSAAGESSQAANRGAEWLAQAHRAVATAETVETQAPLATHVRDPRWADELGARVSLLVRAGESTASLQLTPIELGPVEVNVTVRESQATIHFGASQADTRALLEASLPRLRELLAAQGFQLTDASVSSGFSRSQQQATAPTARAAGEAETSTTEARPVRSLSLLDIYV